MGGFGPVNVKAGRSSNYVTQQIINNLETNCKDSFKALDAKAGGGTSKSCGPRAGGNSMLRVLRSRDFIQGAGEQEEQIRRLFKAKRP